MQLRDCSSRAISFKSWSLTGGGHRAKVTVPERVQGGCGWLASLCLGIQDPRQILALLLCHLQPRALQRQLGYGIWKYHQKPHVNVLQSLTVSSVARGLR